MMWPGLPFSEGGENGENMLVTENPDLAKQLLQLARQMQDEGNFREEGAHVSDLIGCSIKAWLRLIVQNHLDAVAEGEEDPQFSLVLLLGNALHTMLQRRMPEKKVIWQTEFGPVYGHVDMTDPVFAELKSTRTSANKHPVDAHPTYIEQLASYARFENREDGNLIVMFLSGDYGKTTRWPIMKAWEIEWEEGELEAWEQELTRRLALITGPDRPSLDEHYPWECENCGWRKSGACPGGGGTRKPFFTRRNKEATTF